MKVRYVVYAVAAALLLTIAGPIWANTEFFLENFESGTVGSAITTIGWTNVYFGPSNISSTTIASGNSAVAQPPNGPNTATYTKAFAGGAHALAPGETITVTGTTRTLVYGQSFVGVTNGTGWRRVGHYNIGATQTFQLGVMNEGGTDVYSEVSFPLNNPTYSDIMNVRMDITTTSTTAYWSSASDANNWHLIGSKTTVGGGGSAGLSSVSMAYMWEYNDNVSFIDNIRVTDYVPQLSFTGSISGTITLGPDYSGGSSLAPVLVQLTPTGGAGSPKDVLCNSGAYSITGIVPGTYAVKFTGCQWMPTTVPNIVVSPAANTAGVNATLGANGDVDGTGEINSTDLSVVLKNLL